MKRALLVLKLSEATAQLELAALILISIIATAIGPFAHVNWPGGGWIGALALLAAGCALALLLIGPVAKYLACALAGLPQRTTILRIILVGLAAQVCVVLLTHPQVGSDPATYLRLAEKLARGETYSDERGLLAFWPAGLPLFLAPFVGIFGAGILAVTIANLVLYVVGVVAAWQLGKNMFSPSTGLLAALLFSAWPSRLLSSGFASKENLTVAMVLAGIALCVATFSAASRVAWRYAIAAGLAFGMAGLAQPGLLLFVAIIPLAYRYAFQRVGGRQFFLLCAIIFVCMAACLVPWQARNCVIFDYKFCGVATNGGSVFYRANNPLATGSYTAQGEVPLSHLPELEQNKIGFELGKKWIVDHPVGFLKLGVRKLIFLLEDDNYGAYWGILRGGGGNDAESFRDGSTGRIVAFRVAEWISWTFWVVIAGLVARASIGWTRRSSIGDREKLLPLVYPMLYCAVVFSVFESGSRQHAIALAPMLVLAAASIMRAGIR